MAIYVPTAEQLVVEVFVRDMARAKHFSAELGFARVADRGTVVEVAWEGHLLYLDEHPDLPEPPSVPQATVRIMVPDVDHYWQLAHRMKARVIAPIADRYYGLRDFTIADPDGFGLRFGTRLPADGG